MAVSLDDLRTTRPDKPPRTLIYGPQKAGKSTWASEWPDTVWLKLEEGETEGVEMVGWSRFPVDGSKAIENYNDVIEAVASLYGDHPFKNLVCDSASTLEPMIWAEVCRRNGWPSIEAPGFGKGYVEADMLWQEFMQAVSGLRRMKGMGVIIIAHEEIKRIEDPIVGPLDRYIPQLHKRATDIVKKDVDIIAFLNYRIAVSETKGAFNKVHRKGVGAGERVLHFADRPGFMAGNRYGLPDEIPYTRGEGYSAIAPFLPVAPISEPVPAPVRGRRQKEAA